MASGQITLQQTKVYVGPYRYGVRHQVSNAYPDLLQNCFLVGPVASPFDKERLIRVATLDDVIGGAYPVRQLNTFEDAAGAIPAVRNDELVFTSWPAEWGSAAPAPMRVLGPVGNGVQMYEPFWWSSPEPAVGATGIRWELRRAGLRIASGTRGWTHRSGGDGVCLTDRFMALFSSGETALNHLISVQMSVDSLASNAGLTGSAFERYPPGNPITTQLPEV